MSTLHTSEVMHVQYNYINYTLIAVSFIHVDAQITATVHSYVIQASLNIYESQHNCWMTAAKYVTMFSVVTMVGL